MAQPTAPWQHYTYPGPKAMIPGTVMFAGMFTTDASGNVTSVSGMTPGMTVSGTSLSSGVYTVFFGDGPTINQVGNGTIGSNTPAGNLAQGGGSPKIVDRFNRVLYLQANRVQDNGVPTTDLWQTTQKDAVAGQGKLQYLKQNVLLTNQITAQSGVFAPAIAASQTVQVLAVIWAHKDAT